MGRGAGGEGGTRAIATEQRVSQSTAQHTGSAGVIEADYMDLLNFEKSDKYDARQKAALAYTEAITWDVQTDDALWARLHEHFSEPELVELGFFIALTMGQQRWLRTLNIQHHEVLAGTAASMAPGFEDAAASGKSMRDEKYWATDKTSDK